MQYRPLRQHRDAQRTICASRDPSAAGGLRTPPQDDSVFSCRGCRPCTPHCECEHSFLLIICAYCYMLIFNIRLSAVCACLRQATTLSCRRTPPFSFGKSPEPRETLFCSFTFLYQNTPCIAPRSRRNAGCVFSLILKRKCNNHVLIFPGGQKEGLIILWGFEFEFKTDMVSDSASRRHDIYLYSVLLCNIAEFLSFCRVE